ncbi:MAG: hypothetical protein K6T74_00225 [Geminicoccaceae bacterium]|nr:hypothetical protein [Geminicoccaceae bacterium]
MIAKVEPGSSRAVLGLGRVGTTTAEQAAVAGYRPDRRIDFDPHKLVAFAAGRSPVAEPGLDALLESPARSGRLAVSPTIEPILDGLEVVLVCLGTSAGPDGRLDLTALLDLLRQLARRLRRRFPTRALLWIVERSTIVPKTMDRLVVPTLPAEARAEPGSRFDVVYNPEFLREGSALEDLARRHVSSSASAFHERVAVSSGSTTRSRKRSSTSRSVSTRSSSCSTIDSAPSRWRSPTRWAGSRSPRASTPAASPNSC